MKWHIGSTARTALIAGGVAAVTALAVAAGPALAQGSAPASTAPPVIVSGVGHSTVFLGGTVGFKTIGKLHLGKGSWTIFGKADVTVGQSVELHCRLVAGGDSDQVDPEIDASTAFNQQFMLNVTHKFASAGNVVFSCEGSGISVSVYSVKMTAIKAGTLMQVRL